MNDFYYNFSYDNFYDVLNSFYNISYESLSCQPSSYEYLLLHNMNHIKTRPEDKRMMKFDQKKQIIMRIVINKKMNIMIVNMIIVNMKNKKMY